MYARSARFLPSDTHYAVFLRSDTNFGLMSGRSSRLWLPDTHFVVFLRSDTDFLLYVHVLLELCFQTHISFFPCVLIQISVLCTHVLLEFCLRLTYFAVFLRFDTAFGLMCVRLFARLRFSDTHFVVFFCVLIQILVLCTHVLLEFCRPTQILLLCCVLTQIVVLCTHVLLEVCFQTCFLMLCCVLTQISV